MYYSFHYRCHLFPDYMGLFATAWLTFVSAAFCLFKAVFTNLVLAGAWHLQPSWATLHFCTPLYKFTKHAERLFSSSEYKCRWQGGETQVFSEKEPLFCHTNAFWGAEQPPPPCLGKIPSPHSHCRRTQHPWIKASGDSMATYSCPQLKGRNLKPTSAWEPNLTSWEKRNCKGYLAAKINPRCSRFGGVGWWSLQAWSRKNGTSSPTAWQQAGQRWDAEERAALKQNEMLKIEK